MCKSGRVAHELRMATGRQLACDLHAQLASNLRVQMTGNLTAGAGCAMLSNVGQ